MAVSVSGISVGKDVLVGSDDNGRVDNDSSTGTREGMAVGDASNRDGVSVGGTGDSGEGFVSNAGEGVGVVFAEGATTGDIGMVSPVAASIHPINISDSENIANLRTSG
jgi:hypothetical protein